ncbi:MAG TPA: hypothetical protein VIX58_13575, partial [Anaerolineae bacterium]
MASYPTSVKTFTSKTAGQVIQPVDVNDLQDEVNAIEGGLLNGTANLQSSNSTVANLSVLGKSTLVGNVQMNGNSTITGTLTVGGAFSPANLTPTGQATADAQPRCKVVKTSTQSIANITWTALTYQAQDFNVGSLHSTATNPSRITIQSTGVWMFGATVASTLNSQSGFLSFRKNGATFVSGRVKFIGNSSLTEMYQATTIEQMTSTGDYMECMVWQNSGGALE